MHCMKNAIIAMVGMFLLMVWPLGGLISMAFGTILGGGAAESFLFPLYGGIILLTGIVVGAATLILQKLDELKQEIANANKQ